MADLHLLDTKAATLAIRKIRQEQAAEREAARVTPEPQPDLRKFVDRGQRPAPHRAVTPPMPAAPSPAPKEPAKDFLAEALQEQQERFRKLSQELPRPSLEQDEELER